MSLYMRWPLKKFYTFHHLADFNRNTVSEWTMGFRYGNFTLKLARGKKSLASRRPTARSEILYFIHKYIAYFKTSIYSFSLCH